MAGIIFATAMMYLRIFLIILIFNPDLFIRVWLFFIIMTLVSSAIALFLIYLQKYRQKCNK